MSAQELGRTGDLVGAVALWDGFLAPSPASVSGSRPRPSPYEAYVALTERMALPVNASTEVLLAAQQCVQRGQPGLLPAQEADFYLVVASAMFDRGEATFADALRAYQVAVEVTSANQGAGLSAERCVNQLGYLAAALLDVGAFEDAGEVIAQALRHLQLSPLPRVDTETLTVAIKRLLSGDETRPAVDLMHRSQGPPGGDGSAGGAPVPGNVLSEGVGGADSARAMETVGWIRQLEAESASQRGDNATSVALYQALSCFYQRDAGALALTAAQVLARDGDHAHAACALLERLAGTPAWSAHETEALTVAAESYLAAEDVLRARDFASKARTSLDLRPNIRLEPDLCLLQARLAKADGDPTSTTSLYIDAVSAALERRWVGLGPWLDDAAMRAVVTIANEALAYFIEGEDSKALLWVIESMKSARLQAVLAARNAQHRGDSPVRPPADTPPPPGAVGERLRLEYRAQLAACATDIEKLNRIIANEADDVLREGLMRQLERLRDSQEALVGQAKLYDPIWVSMATPPSSPEAADVVVGPGVTAVSMYRSGPSLVCVVVTNGQATISVKELDDAAAGLMVQYADNVTSPETTRAWHDPAALGLTAEDFLSEDTIAAILGCARVVISPHEELHLLPWAMLKCRGRRLLEHLEVAQVPNLGCLQFLPDLSREPRLALFAPPTGQDDEALSSADEVAAIEATAGQMVVECEVGDGATVETLTRMLASTDVDVVHVASHGVAYRSRPVGTGVVAADRVFGLTDLMGLNVHATLMFATSCLLGWRPAELRAQRMAADEALGFPAALMAAGSGVMIASITPAEDTASAALAKCFYEELYAGIPALSAWTRAQRRMLADGFPASGWCGYTYFGGPGKGVPSGSVHDADKVST